MKRKEGKTGGDDGRQRQKHKYEGFELERRRVGRKVLVGRNRGFSLFVWYCVKLEREGRRRRRKDRRKKNKIGRNGMK